MYRWRKFGSSETTLLHRRLKVVLMDEKQREVLQAEQGSTPVGISCEKGCANGQKLGENERLWMRGEWKLRQVIVTLQY